MTMRWRRVDVPGSDECRLVELADGWRLAGLAVWGTGSTAARLAYAVDADAEWRTLRGEVRGRAGQRAVSLEVLRAPSGEWRIGGVAAPHLAGLVDLDLGFTPATNLFPIRRLALCPGEASDAAAAWLDEETWSFRRLPQRYERCDDVHYRYDSPTTAYSAVLTVGADGFVLDYPGLWRAAG